MQPRAGYRRLTDATREPIELAELKNHLRIDGTHEDVYLEGLIISARMYAEKYLRKSLITQTWRLTLDALPNHAFPYFDGWVFWDYSAFLGMFREHNHLRHTIYLQHGPLQAISSFTYYDANGQLQTLAPWNGVNGTQGYQLSANGEMEPRILPAPMMFWPVTNPGQVEAATIEFTAGYGDTPDSIPEPIKKAMLLHIGTSYQNRESSIVGTPSNPVLI